MKKSIQYIFLFFLLLPFTQMQAQQSDKPRLVVGVKIDGLKVERLHEWEKNFRVGGFRKILNDAVYFENMEHTIVSAGNASDLTTILSGTYPFYHSITGDNTFNRQTAKHQSIFFDKKEMGIGSHEQISPNNILVTTLADELKLQNPQTKIHVVAIDAEAAIPMGGHSANSVSWIDNINNRWATSTFYSDGLLRWADLMNVSGVFKKSNKNDLVKELALNIVNNELTNNAQNLHALFLQFNLAEVVTNNKSKANDELNSYIQLDNIMQELIYAINTKYGEEQVLFFFMGSTADMHQPEALNNQRIRSGFFNADRALALLNTYLMAIYGQGNWISGYYGKNIYLNRQLIEERKQNLDEIQNKVANFIVEFEGVHAAYTNTEISMVSDMQNDPRVKYKNSFYRQTAGDIQLLLKPGWLEIDNQNKVVDNSNSPIIRLPFFIMGRGLEATTISTTYKTIDIAPTLSKFMGIPTPNATLGKRIEW